MSDYTEKRITAAEEGQLEIEHRIAELEQKVEQLSLTVISQVGANEPAPESERAESINTEWCVDYTRSLEQVSYAVYSDQTFALEELVSMLEAHGITPDSKPIDRERGRELVCAATTDPWNLDLMKDMRDWIQSVCGEE